MKWSEVTFSLTCFSIIKRTVFEKVITLSQAKKKYILTSKWECKYYKWKSSQKSGSAEQKRHIK